MSTPRTVYLDTLGCEKNLVDSEGALGLLLQQGWRVVDDPGDAEMVVVNTCGFLQVARDESLGRLRELGGAKQEGQRVVAMGCLPQAGTHDLRAEVPGLDHVLGVGQYHELAGLGGEPVVDINPADEAPYLGHASRHLLTPPHVAHLKIAEGCNQTCSFCRIPQLRGRQRSRPVPELLEEAWSLVERGARELVLIAQNSSSYGSDLPGRPGLGELCAALATIPALRWIRIMYAFPPAFRTKLAEEVYAVDKVASYLDIPIQHASPPVLARMKRGYDPAVLARQMDELRRLRPGIMLRTTALVGFPGETEDDVVALLDFLAEVGFDHVATFAYSREESTTSAQWPDDVDASEKEDRRSRVDELQWDLGLARKEAWLGREVELLVDERHDGPAGSSLHELAIEAGEDDRDRWAGPVAAARTEGFGYGIDGGVWLPGDHAPGEFVRARLVACGPYDFLATPTEAPPR